MADKRIRDITESASTFPDYIIGDNDGVSGKTQKLSRSVMQTWVNAIVDLASRLPIVGGTMTGAITFLGATTGIKFDTTNENTASTAGLVSWDVTNRTMKMQQGNGVANQIGQQTDILAVNKTGSTIPNGAMVRLKGAVGNRPEIELADVTNPSLSLNTIGMATESIANNAEGLVTVLGVVADVNTNAFSEGDRLYLSTTGTISNTPPAKPARVVMCGVVVKDAANGSVFVHVEKTYLLNEICDVDTTGTTTGDSLVKLASGIWGLLGTGLLRRLTGKVRFIDSNYEDLNFDAFRTSAGTPAANRPTTTTLADGSVVVAFDGTNMNELIASDEVPHSARVGATHVVHLHLIPTTNTAGTVRFGYEIWWRPTDATSTKVSEELTFTIPANKAGMRLNFDFSAASIPIAGCCSQFSIRIYRNPADAGDNLNGVLMGVSSIGIHFDHDSIGSDSITSKT